MYKILIIKTGHSETFSEQEDSGLCSLGDILRTSFLINFFEGCNITWLTDSKAKDLFLETGVELKFWKDWKTLNLEEYDRVINLEKNKELLCLNLEGIRLDNLALLEEISNTQGLSYQEKLCLFLGIEWRKDLYAFRESRSRGEGIGLNWKVGDKFPEKKLPRSFWLSLEESLGSFGRVKWQEGFEDLGKYINWIDSLDTVVTLDSLGAHIGVALNKNVICLFGPTNIDDLLIYDRGIKIDTSRLSEKEVITQVKDFLNTSFPS
ncbi:glycosyltransferase family 9 protein [Halobacteriovorax marinus]|uniref:glycosyltransferase family 9 protein n=1 Tax=Halobacteriovorax marinus TaxID=97084 RepID=UPI003A9238FC